MHAALAPQRLAAIARDAALSSETTISAPVGAALASVAAFPCAAAAVAGDGPTFHSALEDMAVASAANPHFCCVFYDSVASHVSRIVSASQLDHPLGPAYAHAVSGNTRRLCEQKASAVLQLAGSVLLREGAHVEPRSRVEAVACIRSWAPYAPDVAVLVLEPLVGALRRPIPAVASDVGIAVGDAIDILSSKLPSPMQPLILRKVYSALHEVYARDTCDKLVRHAIAETCVSVADAFADSLLESAPASRDAQAAVGEAVALMSMCAQSASHHTFEAALMAWGVWIAAASVAHCSAAAAITSALPGLVRAVMSHLEALGRRQQGRYANRTGGGASVGASLVVAFDDENDEDEDSYAGISLRNVAVDTLHQAAQLMSVTDYVHVLLDFLDDESALFALAAAGDVACSDGDVAAVASLVPRIVSITLTNGTTYPSTLRRSATRALAAFAHVLVSSAIDDKWLSTALSSACSSLADLGDEPALLLKEVAEAQPSRLVPFLHMLIEAAQASMGRCYESRGQNDRDHPVSVQYSHLGRQRDSRSQVRPSPSEMVVQSLALIASELPDRPMRGDALRRIVHQPFERLLAFANSPDCSQGSTHVPPIVYRDLRLVAIAVRHVNDSQLAVNLLQSVSEALTRLAACYAGDAFVAPALCNLLEVCAMPTLRDPGDVRHRGVDECADGGFSSSKVDQIGLVTSCISLASEAFTQSGPRGEPCWVTTMAELSQQALSAPAHVAEASLVISVRRALEGMGHFAAAEAGGFQARPVLTAAFLRLILVLLHDDPEAVAQSCGLAAVCASAEACGEAAFVSLLVDDASVLQLALSWWSKVLCISRVSDVAVRALSRVGNSQGLCDRVIHAVGLPRGSRRCSFLAADVLLALRGYTPAGTSLVLNVESLFPPGTHAAERVLAYRSISSDFAAGRMGPFRSALSRLRTAKTAGVMCI